MRLVQIFSGTAWAQQASRTICPFHVLMISHRPGSLLYTSGYLFPCHFARGNTEDHVVFMKASDSAMFTSTWVARGDTAAVVVSQVCCLLRRDISEAHEGICQGGAALCGRASHGREAHLCSFLPPGSEISAAIVLKLLFCCTCSRHSPPPPLSAAIIFCGTLNRPLNHQWRPRRSPRQL